jgi:EpsI family protein
MDGWTIHPGAFSEAQLEPPESNVDDRLLRTYRRSDGCEIDIQVFYMNARRNHFWGTEYLRVIQCWYGHYRRVESRPVRIGAEAMANCLLLTRGGTTSSLLYWMQSPGRTSLSGWAHDLWQCRQNLAFSRSDGCVVVVASRWARRAEREQQILAVARHLHRRLDRWLNSRS